MLSKSLKCDVNLNFLKPNRMNEIPGRQAANNAAEARQRAAQVVAGAMNGQPQVQAQPQVFSALYKLLFYFSFKLRALKFCLTRDSEASFQIEL